MQVVHTALTYFFLNASILQKTAKRNIVRHPAKLSNILEYTNMRHSAQFGTRTF